MYAVRKAEVIQGLLLKYINGGKIQIYNTTAYNRYMQCVNTVKRCTTTLWKKDLCESRSSVFMLLQRSKTMTDDLCASAVCRMRLRVKWPRNSRHALWCTYYDLSRTQDAPRGWNYCTKIRKKKNIYIWNLYSLKLYGTPPRPYHVGTRSLKASGEFSSCDLHIIEIVAFISDLRIVQMISDRFRSEKITIIGKNQRFNLLKTKFTKVEWMPK